MLRSSFRLMLAAAVVIPAACARSPRQGGPEGAPAAQSKENAAPDPSVQALKARLAAPQPPAYAAGDPKAADTWAALRRLYESNGYRPVWLVDGRPRPEIAAVREAVRRASEDGLDPAQYDLSPADALLAAKPGGLFKRQKGDVDVRMDADLHLSYTLLKFASHLERGRVPPGQVDEHWFGTERQGDLAQMLKASLDSGKVGDSLERLKSQHPQYAALKRVLARYREVAAGGG